MPIEIPELVLSYSRLPDTSLCAIVRDEMINPAGGIQRFVESTVPFVEEAIIADTGSVDGTRQVLEAMRDIYKNLRVIDIPFEGYATTRNKALSYVKTKRALILDADELITHETPDNDWLTMRNFIEEYDHDNYIFLFDVISPHTISEKEKCGHQIRLFNNSIKNPFIKELWEKVNMSKFIFPKAMPISIKHFLPSPFSLKMKVEEWYMDSIDGKENYSETERLEAWKEAPSNFPFFESWKKYNPRRDNYK